MLAAKKSIVIINGKENQQVKYNVLLLEAKVEGENTLEEEESEANGSRCYSFGFQLIIYLVYLNCYLNCTYYCLWNCLLAQVTL